jgi:hypothetical protein
LPSLRRRSQRCDPKNPAPPVISIRFMKKCCVGVRKVIAAK